MTSSHTSTRLHTMHPPPHVSTILVKTFELFWAQKGLSAVCKLLRGLDLNQRPLGYEPNLSMARLCLSMIYVEVVLRFSTLFWGILFSTCSSSCSQILAQR